MRIPLIICLLFSCITLSYANTNQGANSFFKGIADALNRRAGGTPENTGNIEVQVVQYKYVLVNGQGYKGSDEFITLEQCNNIVHTSGGFWARCEVEK